ncbi:hypothetical protein NL108_008648 [Boleophthalmus pectinirostris]|nr:hypothetical protein NL108_008648 [Boleophthalmus pectinirostris]
MSSRVRGETGLTRRGRCSFDCVLNSYFAFHTHTLLMDTRRNADDAAFKLKTIDVSVEEGNRAAARELDISESMVRFWQRQRDELTQRENTTKAFRGNKSRRPNLKTFLKTWTPAAHIQVHPIYVQF